MKNHLALLIKTQMTHPHRPLRPSPVLGRQNHHPGQIKLDAIAQYRRKFKGHPRTHLGGFDHIIDHGFAVGIGMKRIPKIEGFRIGFRKVFGRLLRGKGREGVLHFGNPFLLLIAAQTGFGGQRPGFTQPFEVKGIGGGGFVPGFHAHPI